jgi:hypothetical protein
MVDCIFNVGFVNALHFRHFFSCPAHVNYTRYKRALYWVDPQLS